MREPRRDNAGGGMTRKGFLLSAGTLGLGYLAGRFLGWPSSGSTAAAPMAIPEQPVVPAREQAAAMANPEPESPAAGWINVKKEGALGDGKTNDTEAIRRAIAKAAKDAGTVYFPAGTYVIRDMLIVAKPMKLIGAGKDSSIIRMAKRNEDAIRINETRDVHISHLQIREVTNNQGGENTGIHVRASHDCTIEHVRVVQSDDSGVRVGYNRTVPSRNCKVLYCDIEDTRRGSGIELIRSEGTIVLGCTVRRSLQHGIRLCGAVGAVVTSNQIYESGTSDISIQGFGNSDREVTHPVTDFLVSHNKCHGKKNGFTIFNNAFTGIISNNIITGSSIGIKMTEPNGYGNRDIQVLGNTLMENETGVAIFGDQRRIVFQQNTIANFRRHNGSSGDVYAFDINAEGKDADLTIEHNSLVNKHAASGDSQVGIRTRNTGRGARIFFRYNQIRFNHPRDRERYWIESGRGQLVLRLAGQDVDTNTSMSYE